jgi:hypothetical protein
MKALSLMVILTFFSLAVVPTGWAQTTGPTTDDPSQSTPSGAGLQAASWLLTLPYGAAKICFAILGGVAGGLTWVFSGGDTDAAMKVWGTSAYGTYVLTPEHLRGDKAVRFFGVPPAKEHAAQNAPASEPAPTK